MSNWNSPPPPTYDAHVNSYTTLTPYLQLPHLLSLTWLAYPILSLIFVAFRLQLSLADAQNAVASAKADLVTSCKAAEEAATSAASMPRYMALATNEQFADAVNGSMRAARAALVLSLTAMEAIINFIIDLYRSTLLCFLELVVRGGLAILIAAVQEVNDALQAVTTALRSSIQSEIGSANNIISSAVDTVNKINPFGKITAPQITVPSLDGLQNVQLPPTIQQALTNLNSSLPSVAAIKDKLEDVINTPFELLKKDINDTFANLSFDPSGLPVPAQNRLTFCQDLDTSVVDDIGRDFLKTAKIGVVILVLVALLLIGLNCLLTWYKWRCMKNHLEYTRQAWTTDPTMVHDKTATGAPQVSLSDHNLMMLQANSEHPLITRITNQISQKFRLTPSQHTHTQWFFNYIFHAPALACFLIGFFGLLSVQIQLTAMGPLVSKYQDRAAATVSDFSNTIAASINNSMYNQSAAYANEINARVNATQTTINDGLFGWVDGTTTTINSTINEFYTDIQNAVATVFNGTILESPANEFLKCFIGSKVDAIESALTFLHDNLQIDMPRVNETVLVLSPESVNEATAPIAAAAIGGGSGDDQGLIGRLVDSYARSLKKERVMFAVFIALWGFVVFMGICVLLWHSYGKPYLEKRGRRKWQSEQRAAVDEFLVYGDRKHDGGKQQFNSFTPLPSPRGSVFKPFWSSRSNSPVDSKGLSDLKNPANLSNETLNTRPTKKPTVRFLNIGKAFGKGSNKNKVTDEEDTAAPASITDPMGPNNRNTAWYGKMASVLARKNPKGDEEFWEEKNEPKPKLTVNTTGQEKPKPTSVSRWSTTPPATQTSWKNIMSPTKKLATLPTLPVAETPTVVVSRASDSELPYNNAGVGLPIRPARRAQNNAIPLDVGPMYEDPFLATSKPAPIAPVIKPSPSSAFPVPLYTGFDSQRNANPFSPPFPAPPRHPKSNQQNLAPPPRDIHRHRRSISANGSNVWRVTNATPGDVSDTASSNGSTMSDTASVSHSRLLTTNHARQSSLVNPFITPFDDEHRVVIAHDPDAHLRKSFQTSPYGVAM